MRHQTAAIPRLTWQDNLCIIVLCCPLHDTFSARMSREQNVANLLCLGQRVIGSALAADIVEICLKTEFSDEERYQRRVGKIVALDRR